MPAMTRTLPSVALDDECARELRLSGKKTDDWRQRRNEAIRRAHYFGASYREIAAEVGLTHVAVMRIVGKAPPGGKDGHGMPDFANELNRDDQRHRAPGEHDDE